jgi:hypothetical protein
MPRLDEREANEASSVMLSHTHNKLNGDTMFEIRRWANEKKMGMNPGKCEQRTDEERTKLEQE